MANDEGPKSFEEVYNDLSREQITRLMQTTEFQANDNLLKLQEIYYGGGTPLEKIDRMKDLFLQSRPKFQLVLEGALLTDGYKAEEIDAGLELLKTADSRAPDKRMDDLTRDNKLIALRKLGQAESYFFDRDEVSRERSFVNLVSPVFSGVTEAVKTEIQRRGFSLPEFAAAIEVQSGRVLMQ